MRRWQFAEDALVSLLPKGARRGSTWFGRMGDVVQQPPVWAGLGGGVGGGRWGQGPAGSRAGQHLLLHHGGRGQPGHQAAGPTTPASRRRRESNGTDHVVVPVRPRRDRSGVHAGGVPGDSGAVHRARPRHHGSSLVNDPQSGPLPDRRVRRRGPGRGRGVGRLEDLPPWPSRRRRERRRRDETARGRHCSCHTGEPCLRASRLTATFGSVHRTAPPPATPRRRVPDVARRCVRNSGYRAS